MEKTVRKRVSVSLTAKGVKTFDCTVEITGDEVSTLEVLKQSDGLVAQLDKRYPGALT